jgi:hypothetical protein
MHHYATADFWKAYQALPTVIRLRAEKQFSLLKTNPQHPSLQLKKVGDRFNNEVWSARVTLSYRALALKRPDGYLWFWIGDHEGYDTILA